MDCQKEILEKIKDGKRTNAEIARAKGSDVSTIHKGLRRLKRKGFVIIDNTRNYQYNKKIVRLTDKGWSYLQFHKEYAQLVERYPELLINDDENSNRQEDANNKPSLWPQQVWKFLFKE